ncbi:MAG: glycosyltransferase family 2 protein [Lachnospiraceae bacterium]|nr:glycosyltransferase family 2 protein [Lachnospiraceae bacterium]
MVIQKLLFPREEVCNEWEMFLHSKAIKKEYPVRITKKQFVKAEGAKLNGRNKLYAKRFKDGGFIIPKGDAVSLQSYFNAFSIGKWRKYTFIEDLSLHLNIKGDVKVRAFNAVGKTYHEGEPTDDTKDRYYFKKASRREIEVSTHKTKDGVTVTFPNLNYEGILYIKIEALEDAVLYGGEYITNTKKENDVNLALCICTFKREEFVTRNVNQVIDGIINNKNSVMKDNVEVFVSDNGQTLPADTFKSDKVFLFPNRNVGGAGGFTRDMIEAVLYRKNNNLSHVILMDDDIILDAEVLERNYLFLKFLKSEYSKAMVGGELFELDKRYLQFEAGAAYRQVVIQSYNQMWDMRNPDAVAGNEVENPMNFNGWWYCCIPVSYVREDNLPLPVFIHRDDVEYGMRNEENGTILLNGLSVWHPQGPGKASTAMNYYDVRNDLICMCDKKDAPTASEVMNHITRGVIGNMLRYRYQVIDCIFYALEDYYKGPDYFMKLDPIENHKELARFNYDFSEPTDVDLSKIKNEKAKDLPRDIYLKSALCWLLPAKDYTRVCSLEDVGLAFRARNIYLYDKNRKEGFMATKSYKEAFRIFFKYLRIMSLIYLKHDRVTKEWASRKKDYTSLSYWEKYLEINK